MTRRSTRLSVVVTIIATSMLLVASAASGAGSSNPGPPAGATADGFSVAVTFTGNAAPRGDRTTVVRVAATCWWETADGPFDSPVAYVTYYASVVSQLPWYAAAAYGPEAAYIDAAASGEDLQWWRATCRDPADYASFTQQTTVINGTTLAVTYRAFPVVNGTVTPPPPLIAPADLARAARDVMVVPRPQVGRNPMASGAGLTGATLVNLPTWFWVTDPAAVGGTTGTRTIRAEIVGTPIWAEVVARTQGLQISSPADATTCPPPSALLQWSPTANENAACTIAFTRASTAYPNGYPVTTTTSWTATWTGPDATSGTLPTLTREFTTAVPVAEVQALVTTNR